MNVPQESEKLYSSVYRGSVYTALQARASSDTSGEYEDNPDPAPVKAAHSHNSMEPD